MGHSDRKEPLYRKVNTRTRGVFHRTGGDYRHERNSKRESEKEAEGHLRGSMHGNKRRGLDYTPLFRFLLSKVGEEWAAVHSEAVKRLDREEPIYWIVARNEAEKKPYVRASENALFNGLFVDDNGRLAKVAPDLRNEDFVPDCPCCTHTFNGIALVNKFQART